MEVEAISQLFAEVSAGLSIAQMQGAGKMRHINIRSLWLQEKVHKKELHLRKIGTELNRADAFTKPLASARLDKLLVSFSFCSGRAGLARGLITGRQAAGVLPEERWG